VKDGDKTKEQCIDELVELRRRIAELEALQAEHERAEQQIREYAESIVETVREPLVVLDADLRVISANRSFYETFKTKPRETVGQLLYDSGTSPSCESFWKRSCPLTQPSTISRWSTNSKLSGDE
jgi:PAS domain-containing protein